MARLMFPAIIAIGIVMVIATIAQEKQWQEFAKVHCKVIGKIDGDTIYGGKNMMYTDGKTGYQCDDGVTYWRSNTW